MDEQESQGLEENQWKDIYHVDDRPLKDHASGTVRSLVIFGILLTFVLILLSVIMHIQRKVTLPFELKLRSQEKTLWYAESIDVKNAFVEPGELVTVGEPLFKISSSDIRSSLKEIYAIQRQIEFLNDYQLDFFSVRKKSLLKRKDQIREQRSLLRAIILDLKASAELESRSLMNSLELHEKIHERNSKLFDEGVLSLQDFESSQKLLEEGRGNKISIESDSKLSITQLQNHLMALVDLEQTLDLKIREEELELIVQKEQLGFDLETLIQNLNIEFGPVEIDENDLLILSPVGGEVEMVIDVTGKLEPGQVLTRIRIGGYSPPYAIAEVASQSVGHIKEGDEAVFKVAGFPHYYYGTLKGKLQTISKSPGSDGRYPVRFVITDYGNLKDDLLPGMGGQVSIFLEEGSIYQHVLRNFLKAFDWD